MKKSKMSRNPVLKFFRELLVVVTGITITVGTGLWVNKKNNEKDLKQYLTALKIELEENVKNYDWYAKMYQKPVRYANYIKSHDEKSVNQDTITYYYPTTNDGFGWSYTFSNIIFRKNAFEMFKTSGVMRQIDDKELLISIWGLYSYMENAQLFFEICFQMQREEATKEAYLKAEGKQIIMPMKIYYSSGFPYGMAQDCKDMSENIKQTLSKLEASKISK